MRTTVYFERNIGRPDRSDITIEMCERIVREAAYSDYQEEKARWRFWGYVAEKGMYLRVVTLYDRETLHNAMWDGNFTRKRRREERG